MLIGIDLDNTIACYDGAIQKLAQNISEIPLYIKREKMGLRDYLRTTGRESEWTEFQGKLYGPGMKFAKPFPGAVSVMKKLLTGGHRLVIVSHRTNRPFAGPQYDLHSAALDWISANLRSKGLFKDGGVNLLETLEAKLNAIHRLNCDLFIDDLLDVLASTNFPTTTTGVLFNPAGNLTPQMGHYSITSWSQIPGLIEQLNK